MESVGINTHVFKAHSVQGAVTTLLLSIGVEKHMVQASGQWSSEDCMDRYDSRLHNLTPWDQVLHARTVPSLRHIVGQRGPTGESH